MSHTLDSLDPALSITLAVDNDPLKKRAIFVDRNAQQVLYRVDGFAFLADKEACFLSGHVHRYHLTCVVGINRSIEPHRIDQRSHKLVHGHDQVMRYLAVGLGGLFTWSSGGSRQLFNRRFRVPIPAQYRAMKVRFFGASDQYTSISCAYTQKAHAALIQDLKTQPVAGDAQGRRSFIQSFLDRSGVKLSFITHLLFFLLLLLASLA